MHAAPAPLPTVYLAPPPSPEPSGLALTEFGTAEGEMAAFATVVAHRLRSLVGGIQGYAELLTDALPRQDERALALGVLEGAAAIERVCAGLVYYSHLPAPVVQPADPLRLATDLVRALGPVADRVVLTSRLGPGVRFVTDPALLRQILLVLLQNALEAAPPEGSVGLRMRTEASIHEASASEVSAPDVLVVDVSGPARSRPDPALAFTLFYTTKTNGLGLGLPLARRLARSLGGRLDLLPPPATTPGGGPASVVTFRLRLPSAAAPQ